MNERYILARAAYAAYGDRVGWVNYQGNPMPQWSGLSHVVQEAWRVAAEAAVVTAARKVGA